MAKALLSDPEITVKEVAGRLGVPVGRFIATFREGGRGLATAEVRAAKAAD